MAPGGVPLSVLNNTVGLLQLGAFGNAILFGINCVQAFTFYQHAKTRNDSTMIKAIVGILWIINTMHLGFNITTVNFYLVQNFNNPVALSGTYWSLACCTLITMISNFFVRLFFAYRIWIISRGSLLVTLPVAVLSFLSFAFGMAFTVESFLHSSFAAMHGISFLVYIPLAIAAVSDICMTAALCFFLYTNRTGIRRTDSIINVLMLYCINASLLTTCLNVVCFVTFLALPTNYIFMALFFVSSKLYFCSLLATLNAREMFRQKTNAVTMPSLRSKQLRSILPNFDADRKEAVPLPVAVSVNTDSHTHVDSVVDLTDSKGTGNSMMMSDMNSVDSRHA